VIGGVYIKTDIIRFKQLVFLGDSKKSLKSFSSAAQRKLGYELLRVQTGEQPSDSKPMPSVGPGVEEIRVWVESGTYRVIYLARRPEAVYVLHAFQKKSQATSPRDLELARKRLANLS
jgi:phage-related protein